MSLGRTVEPGELIFQDLAHSEKAPFIAVHQELDQSQYKQIKESFSSLPHNLGSLGTHPVIHELSTSDLVTLNALKARIRAHVFDVFPLRVMKLPEMKLMERSAVAEYIIQHKLDNFASKIRGSYIAPALHKRQEESRKENDISAFVKNLTKFAILSHTWGGDEPSYQDFLLKSDATAASRGYKKLEEFCKVAQEDYGIEFAWADTICINKLSSSELDESIRSMFTWYRESFMCIIYLEGTETLLELPLDRWFTRGWTLQELLAPLQIKFYNKKWQPLTNLRNDKLDPSKKPDGNTKDHASLLRKFGETYALQSELIRDGISKATGIPINYICDFQPGLRDPPFPERLKWIARRTTTRSEDMPYSMMGVLGVSIFVAYGEGIERAFFRLFQAALEVDWSPGWFLWGGKPVSQNIHPSRMIPSSPACYLSWDPMCERDIRDLGKKVSISLTNTGLPIKVLVVPARMKYRVGFADAVFADNPFDTNITCPLFDGTIVTTVPRELSLLEGGLAAETDDQFALGVLGLDFASRRVYAILLRREYARHQTPWQDEWQCGEWERWEVGEVLSFGLKDKLRGVKVNDWTRIEISKSEVGWIAGKPQIEFYSLCL